MLVAALGERDIRREARASFGPGSRASATVSGPSDLLELVERFREAEKANFAPGRVSSLGLDAGAVSPSIGCGSSSGVRSTSAARARPARGDDEALLQSVLAGYPDRIARRRRPRSPELLLFGGGTATLSELSRGPGSASGWSPRTSRSAPAATGAAAASWCGSRAR